MLTFYIIIAIFIAWIWVDYFRLIDIYEKESIKYVALTFILGCASVFIVLALNNYILDRFSFQLTGNLINDFLYSVFNIGLVEEIAKSIPFLIIYYFFRKEINEPVDYLLYFSVSALGFSAVENVMYMSSYGPNVITTRAILTTVSHMFDTSLIAYGVILFKYRKRSVFVIVFFVFLAALSHGFYDFWLIYEGARDWGWAITLLYFMITISLFAVILNNALNNSSFFTYKKVTNSSKIIERIVIYYAIIFFIQFGFLTYFENLKYAIGNFTGSLFLTGFIIGVTVVRLSRFKLIKGRWESLKIELPFQIIPGDHYYAVGPRIHFKVKGDSLNEAYFNAYYQEYFNLCPLSERNTYLEKPRLAFIEKKIYLKNYKTFFVVKVFDDNEQGRFEMMLLSPKISGTTKAYEKYPIVAVLEIDKISDIDNPNLTARDFSFIEWAFVMPRT